MAKILVVCPICGAELEADEEHIGRDGQCSSCEQMLPIRPAPLPGQELAAEGWLEGAHHYEYTNAGALVSLGAVGLVLLVLAASCMVDWTVPNTFAHWFVRRERWVILVLTATCCTYMAVSLLMRKSMVPAVLTSAAWGMAVTIWTFGILQSCSQLLKEAEAGGQMAARFGSGLQAKPGLYLALVAGLMLIGAGTYFYHQYKGNTMAERRIGPLFLALQAAGLAAALTVVFVHVKPGIGSLGRKAPSAPVATVPSEPGRLA